MLFSGRLAARVGDSLSTCINLPRGFEREKCKSFLVYCYFQQHKFAATTCGQKVPLLNDFREKNAVVDLERARAHLRSRGKASAEELYAELE